MTDTIHLIVDIATPVTLVLVFVIGLMIHKAQSENKIELKDAISTVQTEQGRVKADLISSQTVMQRDMDQKHAENKSDIKAHMVEDKQIFGDINRRLDKQDSDFKERMSKQDLVLSRIEAKVTSRGSKG